jgi:hypothetical protein
MTPVGEKIESIDKASKRIDDKVDIEVNNEKILESLAKLYDIIANGQPKVIDLLLSAKEQKNLKQNRNILISIIDRYKHTYAIANKKNTDLDNKIDYNHGLILLDDLKVVADCVINKCELPDDIYDKLDFEIKIKSYKLLPDKWDSYNASKIHSKLIYRSINFIKKLGDYKKYLVFVSPINSGGVAVELKNDKIRIHVNFESFSKTLVFIKEKSTRKIIDSKEYKDIVPMTLIKKLAE